MATDKSQQELAKTIAEQMFREGFTEFSPQRFHQILGGKLKDVQGEPWRIQKRAIAPLVKGRFRRHFAANDPRNHEEERQLLEEHRQELRRKENERYWKQMNKVCNYETHPID